MMWQDLLLDLRAALRLGHPDAVRAALAAIAAQPEIAANRQIPARLRVEFLYPAGRALADALLAPDVLTDLQRAPLTGLRLLGAVVAGYHYAAGKLPLQKVQVIGKDPRPEVRRALGDTLAEACPPERLLPLGRAWLGNSSPALRHTVLLALRGAVKGQGKALLNLLAPLHGEHEPESSQALVNLLNALGEQGYAREVLRLLETWIQRADLNPWLVGQTLSRRWAAAHAATAYVLLDALEARHGYSRHISNARRALQRHARG